MVHDIMTSLLWSLWALLLSLTMKPGIRYGMREYRWQMLRAAILERDRHTCRECGRVPVYGYVRLEVHHKRRVADGGSYKPWNLVTLCQHCHRRQH